jgi:hypothetical protein
MPDALAQYYIKYNASLSFGRQRRIGYRNPWRVVVTERVVHARSPSPRVGTALPHRIDSDINAHIVEDVGNDGRLDAVMEHQPE